MNEISKERIEISGVEYTLFLNRQGLVSWEKYSREENAKLQEMETKYANASNEITDDTDLFEAVNEELNDSEIVSKTFRKLYWIMLYTEHKLSLAQVNELYDKACEEYGEVQLIQLAQQMIEDMNIDKISKTELKNLTALRPKKK